MKQVCACFVKARREARLPGRQGNAFSNVCHFGSHRRSRPGSTAMSTQSRRALVWRLGFAWKTGWSMNDGRAKASCALFSEFGQLHFGAAVKLWLHLIAWAKMPLLLLNLT